MFRNPFFNKVRVYETYDYIENPYGSYYSWPPAQQPYSGGPLQSFKGSLYPPYYKPIVLGPAMGPENIPILKLGPPVTYTAPTTHTTPTAPTTPTTFIPSIYQQPIEAPMHGPTYDPSNIPYWINQGMYGRNMNY